MSEPLTEGVFVREMERFRGSTETNLAAGNKRFEAIETKLGAINETMGDMVTGEYCIKGKMHDSKLESIIKKMGKTNGRAKRFELGRLKITGFDASDVIKIILAVFIAAGMTLIGLKLYGIDVLAFVQDCPETAEVAGESERPE